MDLIGLERQSVTPVVGEHGDRPGALFLLAAGASAPLQELRDVTWRLVLEDRSHARVVVADLQGRGRDDDVGELVDAGVLRGCPGDLQGARPEAQFFREPPVLAIAIPFRFVGGRATVRVLGHAEAGENMLVRVGIAERVAAFGVEQLPVETVD